MKKKTLDLTPENINAFVPSGEDIGYTHSVFAQCFFPMRKLRNGAKEYQRKNGRSSILIEAGSLLNPKTGDFEKQDVPYGAAARLVMSHIQNHAVRARTVEEGQRVPMGDSLRDFFSQYGKEWGGKNGKQLKAQAQNIAAMHLKIGLWGEEEGAKQINVPQLASEIDFWVEKDTKQRTLWQPEMVLDSRFVVEVRERGMPLDMRHLLALYKSPREMDMFVWLSYRLPRIRQSKGVFIPFFGSNGLINGFGSEKQGNPRQWKTDFLASLKNVLRHYPEARISEEGEGLRLFYSPPLIPKERYELSKGKSLFFVNK